MLGVFDTHCHLFSRVFFEKGTNKILEEAQNEGITFFWNVCYNLKTSYQAILQTYQYPNVCAAVGIHPTEVNAYSFLILEVLEKFLEFKSVVAVGEIGLDYYHKKVNPELQKEWFSKQLKLAKKHKLPVLLHLRNDVNNLTSNVYEDAYKIIKQEKITKGILHCFSGSLKIAEKFIKQGFYISFSGNITFKTKLAEKLIEVIKKISLDKIVVETDAPYLSPHPFIGEVNYPKNILQTVKKIADLRKIPVSVVAKLTSQNAYRLFNV